MSLKDVDRNEFIGLKDLYKKYEIKNENIGIEDTAKAAKSNYEKYAEREQPKLLAERVSLEHAVKFLRLTKMSLSDECLDNQLDVVSGMFGIQYEQLKRLVNGEKYWI